jgi:MoxR-like ATPase
MTREEYIQKVVDSAPPLSADQIARLASLFDTAAEKPRAALHRSPRSEDQRKAAAEAA